MRRSQCVARSGVRPRTHYGEVDTLVSVHLEKTVELEGHLHLGAPGERQRDHVGEGGVGGLRRRSEPFDLVRVLHRSELRQGPAGRHEQAVGGGVLERQQMRRPGLVGDGVAARAEHLGYQLVRVVGPVPPIEDLEPGRSGGRLGQRSFERRHDQRARVGR
jgi:hypothetical protein